tara:strand:- start:228 stop:629 length:402 start_codon:yes stop_codon:yes gene_type:complete
MFKLAVAGVIAKILSNFAKSDKAKSLGINDVVVNEVSNYIKADKIFEQEIDQHLSKELEKARKHDNDINSQVSSYVINIRGLIRPICTVAAFIWYVYAKLNNIDLDSQDYSIIGGILAFWFGFRSYEKKNGIF